MRFSPFIFLICLFLSIISNAQTYYSVAAQTDPNSLANWNTQADGLGTAAPVGSFTADGRTFIIQAGHSYATTANWGITGSSTLQVDGVLTLNHTLTLGTVTTKPGNLTINGIVQANVQHVVANTTGAFTINSGGKYILNHPTTNNGATTFNGVENFNSGSTFEYSSLSAGGFTSSITYHHLIISGSAITATFPPAITINGDLTINNGNITINKTQLVKGNVQVNGGNLILNSSAITYSLTVDGGVAGSGTGMVNVNGGALTMSTGTGSSSIIGNVNVNNGFFTGFSTTVSSALTNTISGSLTIDGGTMNVTANANGIAHILDLNGTLELKNGVLDLNPVAAGTGAGRIYVSGDVTVSGGTLQRTQTSTTGSTGIYFDGSSQTFTWSGGAINTSASKRFYVNNVTTLNEVYSHPTAAQTTINGTEGTPAVGAPWPVSPSTINNLTIDNPNGVTLSVPKAIAGTLIFTEGVLNTTASNLLTITNTATGAVSGAGTGNYVNGPMKWNLSNAPGTYVFPVGKGGNYYPYTLKTSAASSPVITVEAFNTNPGGAPCSGGAVTGLSITEYWNAEINSGTLTASVSLARPSALSTLDAIALSTSVNGDYISIGGSVNGNAVENSKSISALGLFRLAINSNDCQNPSSAGSVSSPANYTPGGVCGASFDPASLTNTQSAAQSCYIEYKWQSSIDGSTWTDINNVTATSYDPPSITQTTYYRRLARSFCKTDWTGAAQTSSIVLLIGNDVISGGLIEGNQATCNASFDPVAITSLEPAGPCTIEYKWQSSTDGTNWLDVAGATAVTYDPTTISQTTWYRRMARKTGSSDWNNAKASNSVKLTVTTAFSINKNPAPDTVYLSIGTAAFTVGTNITSGTVSYQWQVSTDNGFTFSNITNGGVYFGANTATLSVTNPPTSMNNYLYRCEVAISGCTNKFSGTGKLSVLPYNISDPVSTTACAGWNGSITIDVNVSGVGILNSTTSVLRQINLKLGNASCKRDLSTYDFTLTAPDGTTSYKFINNFSGISEPMWIDIKFRDHPALEKVSEYYTDVQRDYFPWSIGYYAVENDYAFASRFNGVNADGVWEITIEESDAASGISIEKAELIFGPDILELDMTSTTIDNACQYATCIGSDGQVLIGTNNLYTECDVNYPGDPANYPPDAFDECSWNGANNNNAWYYFFASSSTAYITVSGLRSLSASTTSPTGGDIQPIILDGSQGCLSATNTSSLSCTDWTYNPSWTVPNGGCSNDESVNNASYLESNGGGSSSSFVYLNGITANAEFKLSGLTPGRRYYLLIDGNGGASSSYYIEALTGCQSCIVNSILPVKFLSFVASLKDKKTDLRWSTMNELNNQYFQIERSADGLNWKLLTTIEGAGVRSEGIRNYKSVDDSPLTGLNYYRIRQVSTDGSVRYSEIRVVNNKMLEGLHIFPNPGRDLFTISGMEKGRMHQIRVLDINGKLIQSAVTGNDIYRLQMNEAAPGMYLIQIDGKENLRMVKQR